MLDLSLRPGDDVAIPANEADRHLRLRLICDGDLAFEVERALEDERFGDVVRVVLDEGFFDEEVEVVLRELELSPTLHLLHERGGDALGYAGDEGAVLLGEDFIFRLIPRNEEVGEGAADGVSYVSEGEDLITPATCDGDFWDGGALIGG